MASQVNVRLPDGLREQLKELSDRSGVPQSRLVRDAVERLVDDFQPMVEAKFRLKALETVEPKGMLTKFSCPVRGCPYESQSSAARCPSHGRKVV